MASPLVVVGLDAADTRLAKRWGCENLLLDQHASIGSMNHSLAEPATLEVWPTIATGLSPDEHGVVLQADERPDRSLMLRLATKSVTVLPDTISHRLLDLKRRAFGDSLPKTSRAHVFAPGEVYNWPGITTCDDWQEEGDWFLAVNDGEMGEKEFTRRHLGHAGKAIGWLGAMGSTDIPIAGAHIHILDHIGHLHANRDEKLEKVYRQVDDLVGWLRNRTDRLAVISDHGMQTSITDDEEPGVHSQTAHFATTEGGDLPESVNEVASWLDARIESARVSDRTTSFDAPTEHLEDLGYL